MAENKQKIIYTIGFKADKSGLEDVRSSLQNLSQMGLTELQLIHPRSTAAAKEELHKIKTAVNDVHDALTASFNVNLNTTDLKIFQQEIIKSQGGLTNLAKTMNHAGTAGKDAFSNLVGTLLTAEDAVKNTNKVLDSMAKTFFNTVKWSISSSVLNAFTGSIQKAWGYAQKLDESLNNIRIVTEKSNDEMEKFARNANKAAKSLGASTTSYTNAALIYYQQGLGERDVQARTQTTIKAANVTGQSAAEVSEQLTAVWNGYKVVAEEAELYVDKLAAVAATTAADLEELSTGMSKVASAANAMGVDIDQLSAQLSTIVSVTRQDSAVVGTALKTIYSRMGDLKVDGIDEFGVSLGDVSSQLETMGIKVLDQQGNLRDMGTVIEEVASKWGTWTEAQQQAAAVAIAGKRQYNNLIALFENWSMYEGALTTSRTSAGTLQKQQDIYMDSIESRLVKLRAASEGLFDSLIDSESTKKLIDVLTLLVEGVDQLTQAFGGLGNMLQMSGGWLTKLFSSEITKGLSGAHTRHLDRKFNSSQNEALLWAQSEFEKTDSKDMTEAQKKAFELKKDELRLSRLLTEDEHKKYNFLIKQTLEIEKQKRELEDKRKLLQEEQMSLAGGKLVGAAKDAAEKAARQRYEDAKTAREKYEQENNKQNPNLNNEAAKARIHLLGTLARTGNLSEDETKEYYTELIGKSRDAAGKAKEGRKKTTSQQAVISKVNEAKKQVKLVEDQVSAWEDLEDKYKDVLEQAKTNSANQKEFNKYLEEAAKILDDNTEELEKRGAAILKNIDATKQHTAAEKALAAEQERVKKSARFKEITNQISDLVGTATAAASALSTLSNAFKILKDDSLSAGEKTGQFVTALGGSLLTLVPLIISSVKAIKVPIVNAAGEIQVEATKTQAAFGWISIAIMAVMALIGGLVALGKALIDNAPLSTIEKTKKAYEETQKAVEDTQNSLRALKDEYQSLMNVMESYQGGRDALDKLAEGTDAWKAKVAELNQQITDLLIKYPQLARYTSINDNGVMEISQLGWDVLLEEQNKSVQMATRAASAAQIGNALAKQDFDEANLVQNTLEKKEGRVEYDRSKEVWSNIIWGVVGGPFGLIPSALTWKDREERAKAEEDEMTMAINSIGDSVDETKATEEIEQFVKANTTAEIKAIEGLENISDATVQALLDNKDAIKQNIDATNDNTIAINNMKKGYLQGIAEEAGIEDTTTFANIAAAIVNAEDMKTADYAEKYKVAGSGVEIGGNLIRRKINDDGEAELVAKEVNKWIQQGYGIAGTVLGDELVGLNQQEFNEKEFTLSNGITVTGRQIREAAAAKDVENVISEKTKITREQILALQKSGLDSRLAYFFSGNTEGLEEWKANGMTLSALNKVSKAAASGGNLGYSIDNAALANILEEERTAISDFVKKEGLEFSIDALSNMSQQDRKTFEDTLAKAEGAGRREDLLTLLSQYMDDPEKFATVARRAAGVDFSNKFATADFFFEQMEDVQIRLRKKELDYFKNINKELDKVNKELERAIGLEKQQLLERQIALEYQNQAQAQKEYDDAQSLFIDSINAHGDQGYLNADGTLNIFAINDRIAELDEDVDTKELEYLNELLSFWDDVIDKEAAAQEAIDRVIDAQIAAFEHQFDSWNHLQEITQKYSDFYLKMADLQEGFGAFDEKTIAERYEKAFNVWIDEKTGDVSDDPLNINTALNKIVTAGSIIDVGVEDWADLWKKVNIDTSHDALNSTVINKYRAWEDAYEFTKKKESEYDSASNILAEKVKAVRDTLEKFSTAKSDVDDKTDSLINEFGKSKFDVAYDAFFASPEKLQYFYDIFGNEISADADNPWVAFAQAIQDRNTAEQEYSTAFDEYEIAWNNETKASTEYAKALDAQSSAWAEYEKSKDELDQWTSNVAFLADALGIAAIHKEDGTMDYDAMKASIGKAIPWLNIDNGTFNTDKFKEMIENDFDTVMEKSESLKESLAEMYSIWTDAQEQILKLYEDEINRLTNINSLLKGSADLSKILGRQTQKFYGSITENLQVSFAHAQTSMGELQEEYKNLFDEKGILKKGITQEMLDTVSESLSKAGENAVKIAQELLGAIADEFSAKVNESIDEAFKLATNLSLDNSMEKWELGLAAEEGYLDSVEATYGIDALQRNIQQSIDETDNLSAQRKLVELREKQEERLNEILKARGKLSQYELDRANAEYELTLKQIALEESQQSANKLKLARDEMGNYTYQYVADQDRIAEAEEELAAAQNELYKLDKERNKSLVNEYYSIWIEYQSKMDEAIRSNDEERIARLQAYYLDENNGVISLIQQELGIATKNLNEIGGLITDDDTWFSQYSEISKSLAGMPLNTLADSISGYINATTGQEGALTQFKESVDTLLNSETGLSASITMLNNTLVGDQGLSAQVDSIHQSTQQILQQVPILAGYVNTIVSNLETYTEKYKEWLSAQIEQPEVKANTKALQRLTTVLEDLGNNKIIDGDVTSTAGTWNSETGRWDWYQEN